MQQQIESKINRDTDKSTSAEIRDNFNPLGNLIYNEKKV